MRVHDTHIDLSGTTHMVVLPSAPKLVDASTGQAATDRESGETLFTVQLLEAFEATAQRALWRSRFFCFTR